jgi:hypothetical protein
VSKGWSDDASRALWALQRADGVLYFGHELRLLSRPELPDADPTPVAALLLSPELPDAPELARALHARESNPMSEGRLGRLARRLAELEGRPPDAAPAAGRWRREDVSEHVARGRARLAELSRALGHARDLAAARAPEDRALAALALGQRALLGRGAPLDALAACARQGVPTSRLAALARDPEDPLVARAAAACLGARGQISAAGPLARVAARAQSARHLHAVDALTLSDALADLLDPLPEEVAWPLARAARRAHLVFGEAAAVELARHGAARHSGPPERLDLLGALLDEVVDAVDRRARLGDAAAVPWLDALFAAPPTRRPLELTRVVRDRLERYGVEVSTSLSALEAAAHAALQRSDSLRAAAEAVSETLRGREHAHDASSEPRSVSAWHLAPALLAPGTPLTPFRGERKVLDVLMRSLGALPRDLFVPHWDAIVAGCQSRKGGWFPSLGPMLRAGIPADLLTDLLAGDDLSQAEALAPDWGFIQEVRQVAARVDELDAPLYPYHVWDCAEAGKERFDDALAASIVAVTLASDLTDEDAVWDLDALYDAFGHERDSDDAETLLATAHALATRAVTSLVGRPTGDLRADLAICRLIHAHDRDRDAILTRARRVLDADAAPAPDPDLAGWFAGPDLTVDVDGRAVHVHASGDLADALATTPTGWAAEPVLALDAALDPWALIVCARDAGSGELLVATRVGVSAEGEVVRAPWFGPAAFDVGLRARADDALLAHARRCGLGSSDTAAPRSTSGALWSRNAPWRRQVADAAPPPRDWPRDQAALIAWELRQAILFEDDEAILQLAHSPDPEVRGAALSWRWRRGLAGAPYSWRDDRVVQRAEAATPTTRDVSTPWLSDFVGDDADLISLTLRGGMPLSLAMRRDDALEVACEHVGLPPGGLAALPVRDGLVLLRRYDAAFVRGNHCRDPFTCASCSGLFTSRADALTAALVRDDDPGALAQEIARSDDPFHLFTLALVALSFPCAPVARAARGALERSPRRHRVSDLLARVLEVNARPEDADVLLARLRDEPANASLARAAHACGAADEVRDLFALPDAPEDLARLAHLDPERVHKRVRRGLARAVPTGDLTLIDPWARAAGFIAARLEDPSFVDDALAAVDPATEEVVVFHARRVAMEHLERTGPAADPLHTRRALEAIHAGDEGAAEAARGLVFSPENHYAIVSHWPEILRGCWPDTPALFTPDERGSVVKGLLRWRFPVYTAASAKSALAWASYGVPEPPEDDLQHHCFLGEDLELVYRAGMFTMVYALADDRVADLARALIFALARLNVASVGARLAELVLMESGLEQDERMAARVVDQIPWDDRTLDALSFVITDHGAVSPATAMMLISRGARELTRADALALAEVWSGHGARGRWAAGELTARARPHGPA